MAKPPPFDVSDEAKAARVTAEGLLALSKIQLQEAERLAERSRQQRKANHFGEAIARTMRLEGR